MATSLASGGGRQDDATDGASEIFLDTDYSVY